MFFRDGRVIGLSGRFRSLWIPLGISVDTGVLEIANLDLGLGLIMGDFVCGFVSSYEGRGARKQTPRGREKACFFSETEESTGDKLIVN